MSTDALRPLGRFDLERSTLARASGQTRSPVRRYAFAILAILTVVALKLALRPVLGNDVPFLLIFGALSLGAWYGGVGPGVTASAIATLACWYFFLVPKDSFALNSHSSVQLVLFIAECGVVVFIGTSLHKVRSNSEKVLTRELGLEQEARREGEARFRLMVENVRDYAIFMLEPTGAIASWNAGAEKLNGYTADEIIGRHFSIFYTEEDRARDHCQHELDVALQSGRYREQGWRLRKDGSRFWADVTITAVKDERGQLIGFGKVTRDMTENRRAQESLRQANEQLEERVRDRTAALEASNKELEAFSYSVSHDLRAPLRGVDGFSKMLLEKYGPSFDEKGRHYLQRIRAGSQRMAKLIDDLLRLSRLSRTDLRWLPVDLGLIADEVAAELQKTDPRRQVTFEIARPARVSGDPHLLRIVLENLIGNAWKFTGKTEHARIEFGTSVRDGRLTYFVRDNGAGFEMEYADKLFAPFQRLHDASEFEGTGIGLATVQRIILRHGGIVGAEGQPNQGATFWFTLPEARS